MAVWPKRVFWRKEHAVDSRQALKAAIDSGNFICEGYLGDLTDAEIMVRPVPGTNHIAWQLGHIIAAEHQMVELLRPKSMPPLPDGFAEKHTKETAGIDDPKKFLTKAEYLAAMKAQRAGTLAALAKMSDADLDGPAPKQLSFLKSAAEVFVMQCSHWLMHAGQWAVVRRKLGRKPLF
jgi:hypothetical protein